MIGNDIVDLALAQKESNWKRNRFLDKIFTKNEQIFINSSEDPTILIWNLWSRKEAVYKIYNRQTGLRGYFPLQIECCYESPFSGTVFCNGFMYFTQSDISTEMIHTIAVARKDLFEKISKINRRTKIYKTNGIPYLIDVQSNFVKPVSISHHGNFWEGITII